MKLNKVKTHLFKLKDSWGWMLIVWDEQSGTLGAGQLRTRADGRVALKAIAEGVGWAEAIERVGHGVYVIEQNINNISAKKGS